MVRRRRLRRPGRRGEWRPGTHKVPGLRSLLGGRALGFLLIAWHAVELEQLLKDRLMLVAPGCTRPPEYVRKIALLVTLIAAP